MRVGDCSGSGTAASGATPPTCVRARGVCVLHATRQAHVNTLLRTAANRAWCKVHGKSLPPPKLPAVVQVSTVP
jgi:hypothetical protein